MNIENILNKTICPGCGKLNPFNLYNEDYFGCKDCLWESDAGLPKIKNIMSLVRFESNNVDLSAFLKTLFEE